MALLINNETMFIHVAKTGGTLFRQYMNALGIPNIEVGEKHESIGSLINSHPHVQFDEVIGFIRLPHTWYRSRWAYAKMTYFKEKIKYMPEAQKHWMAKVWDDDLNKFVENTLKTYPSGIATEYFSGMMKGTNKPVHVLKYEKINEEILKFVNSFDVSLIKELPKLEKNKPLDSSHIGGKISPELLKEIEKTEYLIYKQY